MSGTFRRPPSGNPVIAKPSIEFMDGMEWMRRELDKPMAKYLLFQTVIPGGLTIVCGKPKMGKSFVAQQMILAAATGTRQGIMTTMGQRIVVGHIDLDGPSQASARRLDLFLQGHGLSPEDLGGNYLMYDTRNFRLLQDNNQDKLIASMQERGVQMLVIDTLAKTFSGNENDAQEMGALIASMQAVRSATGAAIVLVHHMNKDSYFKRQPEEMSAAAGLRGSSALEGEYDIILSLQKGPMNGQPSVDVLMTSGKNEEDSWRTFEIETKPTGETVEDVALTYVSGLKYGKRNSGMGTWVPVEMDGKFSRPGKPKADKDI